MKGHKSEHHRKHRETGGVNEAEQDLKEKPEARTNARKIDGEAEERAHGGKAEGGKHHGKEHHHAACKCHKCMGGRAERKRGGMVHHENMDHMKHAKHVGPVHGEHHKEHAGRKPRKAGGRAGADSHPFSSARHGTPAPGRKEEMEFE